MSTEPQTVEEYGIPAVYLLRGVLYRQQEQPWDLLLRYRRRLQDYFAVLQLELIVDEAEGYAYLRQRRTDEETEDEKEDAASLRDFPRLISRRPLTYPLTLLCVLLRKRLLEFEAEGNDVRLVVSAAEIVDMVRLFWEESGTNERKREDKVHQQINRLVEYGFLQPLGNAPDKYEVNRILKAYITIDKLKEVLEKLKVYTAQRE